MARKRTIQPTIWQDPDFGRLSSLSKLIYVGCITQADDEGKLIGHPAVIRSLLFPYGEPSLEEVIGSIDEIISIMKNFIYYDIDNQYYIMLKKWRDHQTLREDRMVKSIYPNPKKESLTTNCQPDDGQMTAEVSKVSKESKEVSMEGLKKLKKELLEKGIIKETKRN